MSPPSKRSVIGLLAVGLLGLALGGCTEIQSPDVDDTDVETQLDTSEQQVTAESSDADAAQSREKVSIDAADDDDGADLGIPAAEQENTGPDFRNVMNADPEPAPWIPHSPDT